MLQAVAPSAKVIQKNNVRNIQLFDERFGFDDPGKIRGADAAIDDRTGNAESCGFNAFPAQMVRGLPREFLDDEIELREFFAGEAVAENLGEVAVLFGKQGQVALGAADITSKDHPLPLV